MLTQARVRELFGYFDGQLIRLIATNNRVKPGAIAGCSDGRGYRQTCVDGKLYKNHRIIWLWHYGYLPENDIDHINKDRSNSRIENLREATRSCNMRNQKQRQSVSGIKGVFWNERRGKWQAHIEILNRKIQLGRTDSKIEAACLRLAAEQAEGWDGCECGSPAFLFVKEYFENKKRQETGKFAAQRGSQAAN